MSDFELPVSLQDGPESRDGSVFRPATEFLGNGMRRQYMERKKGAQAMKISFSQT